MSQRLNIRLRLSAIANKINLPSTAPFASSSNGAIFGTNARIVPLLLSRINFPLNFVNFDSKKMPRGTLRRAKIEIVERFELSSRDSEQRAVALAGPAPQERG